VTGGLVSHAAREHKDPRCAALPDLDRAARRLREAVLVLLDPPPGGLEDLWAAIEGHARLRIDGVVYNAVYGAGYDNPS
jgi:hypothetical protein